MHICFFSENFKKLDFNFHVTKKQIGRVPKYTRIHFTFRREMEWKVSVLCLEGASSSRGEDWVAVLWIVAGPGVIMELSRQSPRALTDVNTNLATVSFSFVVKTLFCLMCLYDQVQFGLYSQ